MKKLIICILLLALLCGCGRVEYREVEPGDLPEYSGSVGKMTPGRYRVTTAFSVGDDEQLYRLIYEFEVE